MRRWWSELWSTMHDEMTVLKFKSLHLRSFNAKQGFGFIENPEAYAMFGRPAWWRVIKKPKRFLRRRRGKKVQFKCNCKPVSNLWLSVNCGKITLYLPLRDVFLHKAQIGNLKVGMEAPEMLFAVWSQSTNTLNLMELVNEPLWHLLCFRAPACTILSTSIFPIWFYYYYMYKMCRWRMVWRWTSLACHRPLFKGTFGLGDARCFGRLVTWRLSMGSHLALLRPVLRRVAPRLKHLARGGPRARRVSYTTCVKKHSKRDTDDSHAPHHTSFAVVRRMEMHPLHLLARGTQLHWIWPRRVFCRRRQETCFAFAFSDCRLIMLYTVWWYWIITLFRRSFVIIVVIWQVPPVLQQDAAIPLKLSCFVWNEPWWDFTTKSKTDLLRLTPTASANLFILHGDGARNWCVLHAHARALGSSPGSQGSAKIRMIGSEWIRMDHIWNIYEYWISDQLGVNEISKKDLRLPICQGFGITMRWEQFLCSSVACCRASQLAQRLLPQAQCLIARRESERILRVVRSCLQLLCDKQRKASLWK